MSQDLYTITISEIDTIFGDKNQGLWNFTFYGNCPPIPRIKERMILDNKEPGDVEVLVENVRYTYEYSIQGKDNTIDVEIFVTLISGDFPE
jgi:hypothetical protein